MADDLAFLKTALNPFGPRKSGSPVPKNQSYGSIDINNDEGDEDESNLYQSSRVSDEGDRNSIAPKTPPREASCANRISDFANVFKAFIGTNYLQMPFAFSQAGLVAGAFGIIVVASLTDHCCNLIVRCKKACVYSLIESSSSRYLTSTSTAGTAAELQAQHPQVMERLEEKAEKAISYPDVGRYACGRWAQNLCSFALILTEFGFALNYFVFVGNTLNAFILAVTPTSNATTTTAATPTASFNSTFRTVTTPPFAGNATSYPPSAIDPNATTFSTTTTSFPPSTTVFPSVSPAASGDITPLYLILIAVQIPIQIGFSLVRDVRSLGPFSTISNFAILIGYVALLSVFYAGLEQMSDAKLAQWSTLPMFFAATTSNYEGIGTIIPIESSMSGNRHRYPKYLHCALMLVTLLLGFFGLSGYVRFGTVVDQVITVTVSTHSASSQLIIVQIVNMTLCLGIILTYPLHMFVIVETMEPFVFGASEASCFHRKRNLSCRRSHRSLALSTELDGSRSMSDPESKPATSSPEDCNGDENIHDTIQELVESYDRELDQLQTSGDTEELLDDDRDDDVDAEGTDLSISVPVAVPDDIPPWKRNAFRIVMVCLTAVSAMFLKNYFFYVSAVTGSLGSVLLAYVLPCYFHIKLCPNEMSQLVLAKNVGIIVFGLAAGVAGIYSVIASFT